MNPAKNFLVHLRLPFQLLLAPFMLFGAALAYGRPDARFGLAFVVFHVCFYGGTTAYNSHYDRDEGPIGGLEAPPPPGPWLLPGSLILQAIGLLLAIFVSRAFFAVCLVCAILGVMYSHPAVRLKGRPIASWLTVIIGQGALGAISGVVALPSYVLSAELATGIFAASAIVGGLYPLSQVFQLEEDAARGDHTVAMMLGKRGTPIAASVLFAIGGVSMAASAFTAGRHREALFFLLSPVPLALGAQWACRPESERAVFRRVAALQLVASTTFAVYAIARLVANGR